METVNVDKLLGNSRPFWNLRFIAMLTKAHVFTLTPSPPLRILYLHIALSFTTSSPKE
jgi:hypothetical protein